jgi:hypothetical protein
MDCVALWTLLFFTQAMLVLRDVIGLSVVMRLLRAAAADVFSLLSIFAIMTLGFIGVARALFGTTDTKFATTTSATVFLLGFFWGDADSSITEQNPVGGGLFFFAYICFVVFFVLNIFVAVLTARFGDVAAAANLHLETYAKMEADVSNFTRSEFRWFWLRKRLFPLLNVVIDSLTFSRCTSAWSDYDKIVDVLYDQIAAKPGVETIASAAYELVVYSSLVPPTALWDTALLRAVQRYDALPHRPSFVLCKRIIMLQSRFAVTRDASLVRVLIAFDEMSTPLEKVVTEQESMRSAFVERLAEMRRADTATSPSSFAASGVFSLGDVANNSTRSGFYGEEQDDDDE